MKERYDSTDFTTNKNFFSNSYIVDIFLFITAAISTGYNFGNIFIMQTQDT